MSRQEHLGSLHTLAHEQATNFRMSSGAGLMVIHITARLPASSVIQPWPTGVGISGIGSKQRFQIAT